MDNFWGRVNLDSLGENFDPDLLEEASDLVRGGQVSEIQLRGSQLSGVVREGGRRYQVVVSPGGDGVELACSCGGMTEGPCTHAVALLLAWVEQEVGKTGGEAGPGATTGGGLARPPQPYLFPPAGAQQVRADWERRLHGRTVKDMREIAAAHHIRLKGTLREQVQEGLLAELIQPQALAGAIESLPADSRRALDLLCSLAEARPRFNENQILPYLEAALGNGLKSRPAEECLADLERRGLYFEAAYAGAYPIPLQAISQPRANPDLFKPYGGSPQRVEEARPFQFTRLALRLLLLAQARKLRCATLTGKPDAWPAPPEAIAGAQEIEISPAPPYLEGGLRGRLAKEVGLPVEQVDLAARLLEEDGFWPRRAPDKLTTRIDEWLEFSPQEQSRQLFLRLARLPAQVELDLARQAGFTAWRHGRLNLSYPEYLFWLGQSRLRLARLMARLPAGEWIEVESILRSLHGLQPGWTLEFYSRQEDPRSRAFWDNAATWTSVGRKRINPLRFEDWRQAYGQFYLVCLTRTFHWLGLLDLGWQGERAAAVRLTEFGEYLVGRRADFAPPQPPAGARSLVILPDWTLELDLDAAPLDLVNLLVRIAEPVPGGKSGGRLAYRINLGGLGQAFEAGWTLEGITARLEEAAGTRLPAGLVERMRPFWQRFGRLQIYEDMTLVEFADDFCLPELLAGTHLSQILLATFSPRLVAVRSEAADEFIAELRARGYTPRLEGGGHGAKPA